jgi:hypothetical protein
VPVIAKEGIQMDDNHRAELMRLRALKSRHLQAARDGGRILVVKRGDVPQIGHAGEVPKLQLPPPAVAARVPVRAKVPAQKS